MPQRALHQRQWLWGALLGLVLALFGLLVWLSGLYEEGQAQARLERDAAGTLVSLRSALNRNVQDIQALQRAPAGSPQWRALAEASLKLHRDWLRLEARDANLRLRASVTSPFLSTANSSQPLGPRESEAAQACDVALRQSGPGYSPSTFMPLVGATGREVMSLCLPVLHEGVLQGFSVVSYGLPDLLAAHVPEALLRLREVSFVEADGARLAVMGQTQRGPRTLVAQQVLELPGNPLLLRLTQWRGATTWFPNVLTALVIAMGLALVSVLALLARDMRRRQQVEMELADALAFFRAMESSLVTGLRARDLEGRITYVNPAFCEMVGFRAEDLIGRMPPPYWPPERIDEYGRRQAWRLAGNAPPREGVESVFMRQSGERFAVLIFEAPLLNKQGVQTGWMGAVLDHSAQQRAEDMARSAQASARLALVGEMASLLSHEINQPLAAIASYATGSLNLLRHTNSAAPSGQDALLANLTQAMARIGEQAERAGRVVRSVQDFVRQRHQNRVAIKPLALFEPIVPLLQLQARKLQVSLYVDCPADLPRVVCDQTLIELVLLNLTRNGMQSMTDAKTHGDGVLRVQVRVQPPSDASQAPRVRFAIADQGHGIDEGVARQLFTPFFSTRDDGLGLGLSLCRTVVEQHGGELTHEPHPPRGTVFVFTLPIESGAT